jgi:hypothetical protein
MSDSLCGPTPQIEISSSPRTATCRGNLGAPRTQRQHAFQRANTISHAKRNSSGRGNHCPFAELLANLGLINTATRRDIGEKHRLNVIDVVLNACATFIR